MTALLVILGIVVVIALWVMSSYNKLVKDLEKWLKNAMGQIGKKC